jgi:hypothetical protein
MSKVTKELVQEKLEEWTPSTKVQETLGLSSMDEALFKKEFQALEDKGIVEREGAKRGLKFKFKTANKESKDASSSDLLAMMKTSPKETTESKPKSKKPEKAVDISELPSEVTIIPKHEYHAEVTNVPLSNLLAFLLKGSTDTDRSISLKRTQKGVIVKTYNSIYLLSEVLYTKENFNKLLKASGISLE